MSKSKKQVPQEEESFQGSDEDDEDEYEVEKILKIRINSKTKKKEYLVKWQNWPMESSTWEPESNLKNVRDIIDEFEAQQLLRGTSVPNLHNPSHSKKNPSSSTASKNKKNPTNQQQPAQQQITKKNNYLINQKYSNEYSDIGLFGTEKKSDQSFGSSSNLGQQESDLFSSTNLNERQQKQYSQQQSNKNGAQESNNIEDQPQVDGQIEYVFDKIENKRFTKGKPEYLVSFQGLSQSQWVLEQDLSDFMVEVNLYNENENKRSLNQQNQIEEESLFKDNIFKNGQTNSASKSNEDLNKEDSQEDNGKIKSLRGKRTQILDSNDDEDSYLKEAEALFQSNQNQNEEQRKSRQLPSKEKQPKSFRQRLTSAVAAAATSSSSVRGQNRKSNDDEGDSYDDNEDDEEEIDPNEIPASKHQMKSNNQSSQKKKQRSTEQRKKQKRFTTEGSQVEQNSQAEQGDFKTDNIESIIILGATGEKQDVLNSRIQVAWKPRDDGKVALPAIYSTSYVRRHEPDIFIEHLMAVLSKLFSAGQKN